MNKAESLYQRALAASERVLGAEHPQTLTNINNLALLYQAQGRYGEAELLYERAVVGSERALGAEHPGTLTSINNLAVLYGFQGRYEEAESFSQCALMACKRGLGAEHPVTLASLNNLAALHKVQGRYGEAELLFQRVLTANKRVLGDEHPDTLVSLGCNPSSAQAKQPMVLTLNRHWRQYQDINAVFPSRFDTVGNRPTNHSNQYCAGSSWHVLRQRPSAFRNVPCGL
ncbi:MAG: Tetratricopeptide repeat-containing protein [Candidatus Kentron sp. G]|nr:MAG: Tetratricopeptide repeat-containing protein [Candidatus Kentron sp. G]VFN06957.1 MAG: Tetratricopeptide repeat-containing protein [Candidatus Kentron sp. G]VFN07870.1 MAG: Tetratricopeptide repeat-containing protein [Candidatus Kentron sp. G]